MQINPNQFPNNETTFFIKGPAGVLETKAETSHVTPLNITAIICHPHPLYGGTMENKVVTTVYRTFKNMGLHVVRFNYRGVGASEGTFADAIGETADLEAIIKWVREVRPDDHIWLAGFSFGSFVAANAASQDNLVTQLLSIAPPVHHYPFESLSMPNCPWLVIQGDADEVVPVNLVCEWFEKTKPQATHPMSLIKMHTASHFFHGRLVELKEKLITHYHEALL